MTQYIWHNGDYKNESDWGFTINTRLRYGDGVFDTMLAIDGVPVHTHLHYKRLIDSAHNIGIRGDIAPSAAQFTDIITEILQRNAQSAGHAVINTYIIRADSARGLLPQTNKSTNSNAAPHIVIRTAPAPKSAAPITAITSPVRRNEGSPLSQIKSMNYGDNIAARLHADDAGANEALMLNNAGNAACFTVGNVYIRRADALFTPPLSSGATAGVIRAIALTRGLAAEKTITLDDIKSADAVYLSNSIRGIVHIHALDGRVFSPTPLPFPNDLHLK